MAIKRKSEVSGPSVPAKLNALVQEAATYAVLSKQYEDAAKDVKTGLVAYLESNDDGFTCELGKGFRTDCALVVMKTTTRYDVDRAALKALIDAGDITVDTILNIATFAGEKLKDCLGTRFSDICTPKTSESLAITPTPEFKAKVAEECPIGQVVSHRESEPAKPAVKVEVEPESKEGVKDAVAAAKAVAKPAKAAPKPVVKTEVDEDLESILNS